MLKLTDQEKQEIIRFLEAGKKGQPPAVATVEINTADTNSYSLESELSAADIF